MINNLYVIVSQTPIENFKDKSFAEVEQYIAESDSLFAIAKYKNLKELQHSTYGPVFSSILWYNFVKNEPLYVYSFLDSQYKELFPIFVSNHTDLTEYSSMDREQMSKMILINNSDRLIKNDEEFDYINYLINSMTHNDYKKNPIFNCIIS